MVADRALSVQFYPKVGWNWAKWQKFTISVDFKLTFGLWIVLMKGHCHRLSAAEFQPPSPEIRGVCEMIGYFVAIVNMSSP